ncbi:TPA: phage tail protein [Yersinia enterocolitica]|uniref:phage tail-collar fiber domain-containing protein n=1 Tax=Yersinia enterocolitica TaxID=630 RepID=UPI000327E9A6|nr:phage tail protein [Yersinia enterocolitica]MCE3109898.1 phage tail protein [Yersinia enterocolitica]MCF3931626.1 phage tail protein [Yersinia enterocolitica]CCV30149.1 probable variable tail fibre protein [Yersinia enterocolitica (type O:9) str. YE212/02]CCV38626.1 probable variable tail fibre protein [Yersinia enterocolitica (type O:9) str. YE56/03]CNC78309.1 variable tail fiber protein [Yersinia enterocolitica]
MTAKYYALLTHIGAAKLANATALGTRLEITHMVVGDGGGTLPTPDPAQIKLVNEQRRAALNALTIDPSNPRQIIAEQIIPETEGGWWIREIGLLNKSGELIAIANCPESYKPKMQEGSGRTQLIRMIFMVSSTASVMLKIIPSAVLTARNYADDKAIEVKTYIDELMIAHENSCNHPDASLYAKGFTRLSNAIDSKNETQAATPRAVQKAVNAAATLMRDHLDTPYPHPQYLLASKNLFDLRNTKAARKNLQLGSAATRNVGNAQDELMEVGAFGWGGPCIMASAGINALTKTGMYCVNQYAANIPKDFGDATIQHIQNDALTAHQFIFSTNNAHSAAKVAYRLRSYGQWREWIDIVTSRSQALPPIGIPLPYPGTTPPAGYLKCNGAAFYHYLYPALATLYPDHKLPDLRGEFIRGFDDGRGIDTGRTLLSAQTDALQNITGGINGVSESLGSAAESNFSGAFGKSTAIGNDNTPHHTDITHCGSFDFDASRVVRTATETRPRNISFCYILRAV